MKSIYYRIRYGKPIVLVSGLPRSGTSMLMQMLEKGGLPIVSDQIRTPDEDNPKGYHELEREQGLDERSPRSGNQDYLFSPSGFASQSELSSHFHAPESG